MIVSDSHKFICLQPWKVASTTIYGRLKHYDTGRVPQAPKFDDTLNVLLHKHIPLDVAVRLPDWRDDYFRFTFVRNPYDRIYSGFEQRKHRFSKVAEADLSPEELKERDCVGMGFDAFLEYQRVRKESGDHVVGWELHTYVFHQNVLKLDYVGCVEQFEASFAKVCALLGMATGPDTAGVNGNVRFKGGRSADAATLDEARYRYLDKFTPQGIECVNTIYRDDFTLLGYRLLDPATFAASPDAYADVSPVSERSILRDYAPVPPSALPTTP